MANGTYIFESGQPLTFGQPVENDFVYSKGDLVSDSNQAEYTFIRDRGIGGHNLVGRLFTEDGELLAQLPFEDNEFDSGRFGWRHNSMPEYEVSAYFDNAVMMDGRVIEQFDSMSHYSGNTGNFELVSSPVSEGTYSLHGYRNTNRLNTILTHSLTNLPSRGEPFSFRINLAHKNAGSSGCVFAAQDSDTYYEFVVGGREDAENETTNSLGFIKTRNGELETDNRAHAPILDHLNEWLLVEVWW